MKNLTIFVLGFLLVLHVTQANCATIYVEKDGTGDFSVLQEAIDAAGDGDVLQIGPGRYNNSIYQYPWGNFRAWVHGDKSLSFIGSGTEETIIGPEVYQGVNQDWGIFCDPGSEYIKIQDIRFENLDRMAVCTYSDVFEIENCIFDECNISVGPYGGDSATIENCQFYNCHEGHYSVSCKVPHVEISNLLFQNCWGGIRSDNYGTNDVSISDCVFDGGGVGTRGIFFSDTGGTVENCLFQDLTVVGFTCTNGQYINLIDNVFDGIRRNDIYFGRCVTLNYGESFQAVGNIFTSSEVAFYISSPFDQCSINNNHIFRDDEDESWFVRTYDDWSYRDVFIDFSNNYWGTTNPDEISQWIFDGYDSDEVTIYIDFLPLADGTISTDRTTFDGLKAMYRD